jgi:hypothetical protein
MCFIVVAPLNVVEVGSGLIRALRTGGFNYRREPLSDLMLNVGDYVELSCI